MKVNIKGLVFTGFAAAILSANAMAAPAAGDNIVTSKSYVDAKIVQTTDGTATDKAPSENAVKAALATKQPIQSDSSYKVGQSNTWQPLNSAVAVASGGYLAKTDNGDGSVTLNIDTTSQLQTDGSSLSSGSGKLITEGAVAAAIAANGGAVNTGILTVEQNNVQIGQFNANDSTSPTIDIVAPSWDATSTDAGYIDGKPTIDTTASGISSATSADTKVLPTTYAVQQYVTDSAIVGRGQLTVTQNGVTAGTFGANDSTAASIGIAAPNWDQASDTAADYIANKPTISHTASDISSATSADTKELPTVYAVQQYVQSQTGGTVIPARDDTICTDSTPCALVYETDGAHWRTMATATDTTGGACGDAAGTGCNTSI